MADRESPKRYALYLGCTAPVRALNYERAAGQAARWDRADRHQRLWLLRLSAQSSAADAALLLAAATWPGEEQGWTVRTVQLVHRHAGRANHSLHMTKRCASAPTRPGSSDRPPYNGTIRCGISSASCTNRWAGRIREAVTVDLSGLRWRLTTAATI